tara:strand:- start:95 stop:316 length:222 start_codon:yes stop_codon:yes gene_type:complete
VECFSLPCFLARFFFCSKDETEPRKKRIADYHQIRGARKTLMKIVIMWMVVMMFGVAELEVGSKGLKRVEGVE